MKRLRKEHWAAALVTLVVLGAGGAFLYKMVQFARTVAQADIAGFAVIPITAYVLVGIGFTCLFVWALLRGEFNNIEKVKYDILEREEALERAEAGESARDEEQP